MVTRGPPGQEPLPPGCPILRPLLPALLLALTAHAATSAGSDPARVWLARAALAVERGDAAEATRALAWVERLDPGPEAALAVARLRLARGDVDAAALDRVVAAAARAPSLWPEAHAAAARHGRLDAVLDAWAAAEVPDAVVAVRGRALADGGRHAAATADLARAMAWAPTPELLARWTTSAGACGRLDDVVAWARVVGAGRFGEAWTDALTALQDAETRANAPR